MNPPKIDLTHTALVLIDLQKGIAAMPGLAPHGGPDVIANAVKLARRFRVAKAPVVLVHVTFAADGSDMVKVQTDASMQRPAFPPDWDQIVPELGPEPTDILVTKRNWGAFYGTNLDLHLRRRGVKTIVLGGIATNMGVESTARPAHEHGYQVIFVEDAMSSRSEELHTFAVTKIFPMIGLVRKTEEVLAGCAAEQ
jgi:nicotinamidase-related amidase